MRIIPLDLNKDYSDVVLEAINTLEKGGVVVYPTDTLYGLGVNALDSWAVEKIFKIKKRGLSKPLPIIVRDVEWVKELAYIDPWHKKIFKKIWPGRVTAVLSKREIIPDVVTANNPTIGIRVPSYPFIDFLLKKYGYPLTSTSANISGQEPTNNIHDIIQLFAKESIRPDLVIDAGILPPPQPDTVLDLTSRQPKILRVGPSKPAELLKLLEI